MNLFDLTGKVALVTGGAHSIGFGIGVGLAQAGATVCLVDSVDVICEKCPNNKAGVCETAELVEGYDKKTLEYCGLQLNDVLSFADYQKRVLERIIFAGEREKICGNCQWSSICRLETSEDK